MALGKQISYQNSVISELTESIEYTIKRLAEYKSRKDIDDSDRDYLNVINALKLHVTKLEDKINAA